MKRLVGYVRTYKWHFILAIAAMFLSIGLDMFNPRLQQAIVDDVILHGQMKEFGPLLLGLLGITLGRVIFGYVKEYAFDFGAQKVVASLRQNLFDHLETLSFTFFDGMNTGELMSRLKEDVDSVWRAL
ncbi:MAG TPA: ABC transporter transmembrane domain-containing protein, partial [Bacillota bacterium]